MLQPASITSLLNQLITDNDSIAAKGGGGTIGPHTALLTLLDSSELYAVATRLVETPPQKSDVASILASTVAAPSYGGNGKVKVVPLTLDERAACLSAIGVTAWRQATEVSAHKKGEKREGKGEQVSKVVMAGSCVSVAKHAVTGMTSSKGISKELVPLLLESDLGRILVMPIIPSAPILSPSRSEFASGDEQHDESNPFSGEQQKPFMLLILNASSDSFPPSSVPKSPSTPNALASSTATLSANTPARSRLRSGGTTPTSTRSDHTATPSRSPVSDSFPTGPTAPHSTSPMVGSSHVEAGSSGMHGSGGGAEEEWEAKIWSGLYGQAKALARVLAPSLTKCGVGQHYTDDATTHQGGRQSGVVSDDDADA